VSTPDITTMQKVVGAITALLVAALSAANGFGAHLTVAQDTQILAIWVALGAFAVTADAIIRSGRAKAHAAIVVAANAATAPAAAPVSAAGTVTVTLPTTSPTG